MLIEAHSFFERVRHNLQLILSTLEVLLKESSSELGQKPPSSSPTALPPFSNPQLPISTAALKSILALQNTTLKSAVAEFCTASKAVEEPENFNQNETSKLLTPEEDLQVSCTDLDWRRLADRIQGSLEATGNPVQVSLHFEEEAFLPESQPKLQHLSIGYLPPHGGSLRILQTAGSAGLPPYQVELSGSEDAPEERLDVAWILPFTAGGVNGTSLILVTPGGRYCLLELLASQKQLLSCKLASV